MVVKLGFKVFFARKLLDFYQKQINILYEREGLTDDVLQKQLFINKKRHELNIPDSSEFIFEEFVQ